MGHYPESGPGRDIIENWKLSRIDAIRNRDKPNSIKKILKNEDFLKKLRAELKTSKSSNRTLEDYMEFNANLLLYNKKIPEEVTEEDVRNHISKYLSDESPKSIILFLSAIDYAYTHLLEKDITLGIERPKRWWQYF